MLTIISCKTKTAIWTTSMCTLLLENNRKKQERILFWTKEKSPAIEAECVVEGSLTFFFLFLSFVLRSQRRKQSPRERDREVGGGRGKRG